MIDAAEKLEMLRTRLAAAVEEFNAAQEPADRIELHAEIVELRSRLADAEREQREAACA